MFCQNYQKIAKVLVHNSNSNSVDQLSNRVVHVSVQLFSNKILAEKVVREQNLLHIMVKVLHDMARPTLVTFRRGGIERILLKIPDKLVNLHFHFEMYIAIITTCIIVVSREMVTVETENFLYPYTVCDLHHKNFFECTKSL